MTINKEQEAKSFEGLGIAPRLLSIINSLGFVKPTPIQAQSIPVSLQRKDIVGIAQTGTGKTLAFGVPMIQLLAIHKGIGLVILPTRELAQQVEDNLKKIGEKINLRTAVVIGGVPIGGQLKALKQNPHIIIATPGRLIDHVERKTVNLSTVKILVLDEADMMLDMGFLPQIRTILKQVPKVRQTMLFSATMPAEVVKIASEYMSLPLRIEVAPAGTSAKNIKQEMLIMDGDNRLNYLKKVLSESSGKVLIFARTKRIVKRLTEKMVKFGFTAAEIHSNRSQGQRKKALAGFKNGQFRIMVATDIAARGIDVSGIELVINYDLPTKSTDYVHRIGRTARAGKSGKAISFVLPTQLKDIKEIEKLISKTIKTTKIATDKSIPREVLNTGYKRRASGSARYNQGRARAKKPFRLNNKKADFSSKATTKKTSGPVSNFKTSNKNTSRFKRKTTTSSNARSNQNKSTSFSRIPMTNRQRFLKSMARTR